MVKPVRRVFSDVKQWARLMWRWAFNIYKRRRDLDKTASICERSHTVRTGDKLIKGEVEENTELAQNEETLQKIEATSKNNFRRENFFQRKDTVRGKALMTKKTAQIVKESQQTDEELAINYYLANLLLLSQWTVVKLLCEQNFMCMNKASDMFKANIRKYLAFAMTHIYLKKREKNPNVPNENANQILNLF